MSNKGHFVWHELMTRDSEKAKDFYSKVAGWASVPMEGGIEYTMFKRDADAEGWVGGMMRMAEPDFPAEIPSHWMGYVGTDDVDATAERVKELGGQIYHGPADIPEVGRFAVCADPKGAVFSLFQGMEGGEDKAPQLGEFSWNELSTPDYVASFDFYRDLVGWEIDQDVDMGGVMTYRLFKPSGSDRAIGGMYTENDMARPSAWMFYISVPDINAAVDAVKANGGKVLNGPVEVPGGDFISQCQDPEGTYFALQSSAGTATAG